MARQMAITVLLMHSPHNGNPFQWTHWSKPIWVAQLSFHAFHSRDIHVEQTSELAFFWIYLSSNNSSIGWDIFRYNFVLFYQFHLVSLVAAVSKSVNSRLSAQLAQCATITTHNVLLLTCLCLLPCMHIFTISCYHRRQVFNQSNCEKFVPLNSQAFACWDRIVKPFNLDSILFH